MSKTIQILDVYTSTPTLVGVHWPLTKLMGRGASGATSGVMWHPLDSTNHPEFC